MELRHTIIPNPDYHLIYLINEKGEKGTGLISNLSSARLITDLAASSEDTIER
jgi:hypothetical protein